MLDKASNDALLCEIDLAVFAHNRQQGLFVAYTMLLQGKQMYLKQSTSSYENLLPMGFSVSATEKLSEVSFDEIKLSAENINTNNVSLMNNNFTERSLAPKWSKFLNGLFN